MNHPNRGASYTLSPKLEINASEVHAHEGQGAGDDGADESDKQTIIQQVEP